MALPSSGQLSLSQINVELGNSASSQASLRSMSSTAGKSIPDTVSEFYGYSGGDNLVASWTNLNTTSNTNTTIDEYYTLNVSGLSTGTSVRPRITITVNTFSGSSGGITFYWSINSTSFTSTITSFIVPATGSQSYNIPTVGYLDPGETLRMRWSGNKTSTTVCAFDVQIETTSWTIGSGSVGSISLASPNNVGRIWF